MLIIKIDPEHCHVHGWIDPEPKECGLATAVAALQGQDDKGLLDLTTSILNPNDSLIIS